MAVGHCKGKIEVKPKRPVPHPVAAVLSGIELFCGGGRGASIK
jgi:hypothetical protein